MIKFKVIVPSDSYPSMTSGVWCRSPATYGIVRDGVQIGTIRNDGSLWYICDNEYRTRPNLFFMSLKDAKKWAIENYRTEEAAVPGLRDLFRGL